MAGSLNQVELIGHLGGDPESRSFPNGGKVVNFSLATGETWKDRATGERKERTEWHRIAIFVGEDGRGPGDFVERYLKKGSYVYIRGQLETRKWQDQQGTDRYSTEVVLRGFNGQVVSLDKVQQDAGSRGYDNRGYGGRDGGAQGGGSRGGSSGGGSRGGGSSGGQGGFGGGFGDDLDDDVPF